MKIILVKSERETGYFVRVDLDKTNRGLGTITIAVNEEVELENQR